MQDFPAMIVRGDAKNPTMAVERLSLDALPAGDVVVEVEWSSLNYKDALATRAHPGVVRSLPHVPGIDAAGRVVHSDSGEYKAGDAVIVTGHGLGAPSWGGWSRYIRVPAEWVVAMPEGLDARRAMIFGTAGFTAAQCVAAIDKHGILPDAGDVVVTGATGGVGSIAVALLAKLGYRVVAVTGKPDQAEALRALGAAEVVGREAVHDESGASLLKSRWAAAVDTVGGEPLATIVRATQHRGCVACCGLVAGEDLPLTVHPFILRGVTLAGIDSAKCPRGPRLDIWDRLAGPWRVDLPASMVAECGLEELPKRVETILEGEVVGRTLVRLG
ncbi:putative acrylyl-CoA reductase AcuI [Pirellulimonas nuda]|uniref:Putative acrylyl-CoA reductase AcuI n=1 Tax=Pirellulimonas nuda TaxID=2528009 RepID=A0A518DJU4_9BACT|nr:YhdH/YhfP family quinone oxidoreductase [Pirellulimonas nuda]QDU91755.1 putative acrylyl-CoA reductase AcuI [Pirellulimonas nuda]